METNLMAKDSIEHIAESQPINDNLPEPTIIAEPIGAGASAEVVAIDTSNETLVEVDDAQHGQPQGPSLPSSVTAEEGGEELILTDRATAGDTQDAEKERSRDRREL